MTQIIDSQLEILKRAPAHPSDVWQGGIFRMPAWITEERKKPYRPLVPIWISVEKRAAFTGDLIRPEESDPRAAVLTLAKGASQSPHGGYRPARVEVRDPELAEYLRAELATVGIEVSLVESLEHIDSFLREMAEDIAGSTSVCAALDGEGVTVERMAAFADAAAALYRAAPWNHLSNVDLVRIESPVPDPRLSHMVVMGLSSGYRGIGFFGSQEEFESMLREDEEEDLIETQTFWSLDYNPLFGIPFPDADLWQEHNLAVAGPDAYPVVMRSEPDETFRRPDARTLAFFEGLLRALAATTEDELDSGRWTKRVDTFDGPADVTLALPGILEPGTAGGVALESGLPDRRSLEKALLALGQMIEDKEFDNVEEMDTFIRSQLGGGSPPEFKTRNAKEKAQDLIFRALDAEGRLRVKLARQALATDPDCADAYVVLAECMPDPERRLELYRKGVEAGERAIGKETFEEDVGHFWGILQTRPYMRARAGLAGCLQERGDVEEAIEHYMDLLRLNPSDNMGLRLTLVPLLLQLGDDARARVLLDMYADDESALIVYARALHAFRKDGDSPRARNLLKKARRTNPHLAEFLLGKLEMPEDIPEYYSLGSKEEAIAQGPELAPAWKRTRGAMDWLKTQVKGKKKASAAKRRGKAASRKGSGGKRGGGSGGARGRA